MELLQQVVAPCEQQRPNTSGQRVGPFPGLSDLVEVVCNLCRLLDDGSRSGKHTLFRLRRLHVFSLNTGILDRVRNPNTGGLEMLRIDVELLRDWKERLL